MSKTSAEIHRHKVDVFNEQHVHIERVHGVGDPCNKGVAYRMSGAFGAQTVTFQDGDTSAGINGITNEALLAIVADRLECFQRGAFSCRENALALTKIEEALHWLGARKKRREQVDAKAKGLP